MPTEAPRAGPPVATRVPFLDLQAQYATLRPEIQAAIVRVCDAQRFILGEEVELFEREVAAALEVPHAVGMSSGTDALLASLMSLGIGRGDEVVTSAFSFFATAGCVVRLGARPVFVDIDPHTFNLDPAGVAAAMTSRTRAIVPVHLFGRTADLPPLLEVARRAGVPVVEDACQAIGARCGSRLAGGLGAAGCFSFYPGKNLGAFGDAGLVVTHDAALADRLRALRHHGQTGVYRHEVVGGNFRLDALQAAVLRVKLPHLAGWNARRARHASRYLGLFRDQGLMPPVIPPSVADEPGHTYHQYVIRVPHRDAVRAGLAARGIGTAVYYPIPLHLQECFAFLGHRSGEFPHAEAAATDSLALPIYPELSDGQQVDVVQSLAECLAA